MHEWILTSEGQTLAQLVTAQEALGNTVLQQDADNSRVLVDSPSGGSGLANALVYKGATDCSGNPNYPAADAGHLYIVSVAGKIGGASGVSVEVGDSFICKTDGTAAGTQAQRGAAWNVVQGNLAGPIPVKASGAEVDTGTDDAKFLTAKAVNDSHNVPSVAPGADGNVLTSDGTDWVSEAAGGGGVTNSAPANVLMKSDGTNAIASRFTDDGEGGTVNFGVDGELNINGFAASVELTGIDDLGTHILSSRGDGAASKRFAIQGDGHLEWGPGTSGFDTALLRSGVGQLALGGVSLAPSDENGGPFALGTVLTPFSTVFSDVIKLTPTAFAALPASPSEGMMAWVNDSNTAVWGATIAGGGTDKVLAVYNGTNWTVAGK